MSILLSNKAPQRANWGAFVIIVAICFKRAACSERQSKLCVRVRKTPYGKRFSLERGTPRGA